MEVKAVPVSQKKSVPTDNMRKLQRLPGSSSPSSAGPDLTFGGLPTPKLEATYEPVIVKEARYIAITMMKVSMTHSLPLFIYFFQIFRGTDLFAYLLLSVPFVRCFFCFFTLKWQNNPKTVRAV